MIESIWDRNIDINIVDISNKVHKHIIHNLLALLDMLNEIKNGKFFIQYIDLHPILWYYIFVSNKWYKTIFIAFDVKKVSERSQYEYYFYKGRFQHHDGGRG